MFQMFEDFLLPLHLHNDFGFAAMAMSFQQLAKESDEKKSRGLNRHLPTSFLLRHATELYLKSSIVILNKHLQLTNGTNEMICSIRRNSKTVSFKKVHSIEDLFTHFKYLVETHKEQLNKSGKTDWTKIPDHVEADIKTVEKFDRSSTFFRYPDPSFPFNDSIKSSSQEQTPGLPKEGPNISLILQGGPKTRVFTLKDNPVSDVSDALIRLADTFGGAAFGLKYEFGTKTIE